LKIKPYISGTLRKLGLLDLFDRLLFNVQRLRYRAANKKFIAANPGIAIPPDYFIYETYRLKIDEYYNDGLNSAGELIALVRKYKDVNVPRLNLLDWGCGTGRITRHFPFHLGPEALVAGSDYNSRYIDWCRASLPGVHWNVNRLDPPLQYENNFFDVVISLSVFTHLSAQNHPRWMDELHRVAKPGGILIISTQGDAFRGKLLQEEKRNFDNGLLVTRESSTEGHRLFSSFQPERFMHTLIKDKFKVLELIKGEAQLPAQDMWVLQKLN
jgi:2-polyprenyl-3-methyl-5-hydroxy-6-metoxy-1,4-benzoquinol methylase